MVPRGAILFSFNFNNLTVICCHYKRYRVLLGVISMCNVFADWRDLHKYAKRAGPTGVKCCIPLTHDDVYRDDIAIDRAVVAVITLSRIDCRT